MADPQPVPLAEAIERMSDAARAYLDGPVAQLRAAVDRSTRSTYEADTAAADAAGYYLQLARAWWGGFNAVADVTAILAATPGDGHRFEVAIPPVEVPSTVRVVSREWTWQFDAEPAGAAIQVLPPLVLPPGTSGVWLRATPMVGEPSWQVVLEIAPLGSGRGTRVVTRLDAATERRSTGP